MNDLDPILREAMTRVRGPVGAHPSMPDVRRRARRHNRRRMAATAGVVACTGVATAALVIRRDSADHSGIATGSAPIDSTDSTTSGVFLDATTTYPMATTVPMAVDVTIEASLVWDALSNLQNDPSAAGLVYPADTVDVDQMPTAEMFGCSTDECGAMFNYIAWHELSQSLGFPSVQHLQAMNPGIDYGQLPRAGDVVQGVYPSFNSTPPTYDFGNTTTTSTSTSLFEGVTLIDGGAPAGAMEDAYQRLAGYNRTIVPSSGKTVEQTMLMPIGNNTSIATAVGDLLGIDGSATWDPSLVGAPVEGLVAVVIGPDYFDRVQGATATTSVPATTTTSTTTVVP